jgi:sulfur carrier protein ThiS
MGRGGTVALGVTVRVKLFSDMMRYHPADRGRFTIELPAGATVETLLAAIGATDEKDLIIGVNGDLGHRDTLLSDQGEVELITPMVGG